MGRTVLVLVDIDGTTSSTPVHMRGFNARLSEAFPQIGEALPEILAKRADFRNEFAHLSFAGQDEVWRQRFPGTTTHSQLDIYKTFAPEGVFDEATTTAVDRWVTDPANFGYAEYSDVGPMFSGLRKMGVPTVLFTLGQYNRPDGTPGWQRLKIQSSPRLSGLPSHITETLPAGGKSEVIGQAYDAESEVFRFPLTDGSGENVEAGRVVLVDDSIHNLSHMPERSLGILIDRKGKYADWKVPANVRVVRLLEDVPGIVAAFAEEEICAV